MKWKSSAIVQNKRKTLPLFHSESRPPDWSEILCRVIESPLAWRRSLVDDCDSKATEALREVQVNQHMQTLPQCDYLFSLTWHSGCTSRLAAGPLSLRGQCRKRPRRKEKQINLMLFWGPSQLLHLEMHKRREKIPLCSSESDSCEHPRKEQRASSDRPRLLWTSIQFWITELSPGTRTPYSTLQ